MRKIFKMAILALVGSLLGFVVSLNPKINLKAELPTVMPISKEYYNGILRGYGDAEFQWGGFYFHSGIDIATNVPNNSSDNIKTPVFAMRSGIIQEIGKDRIIIYVGSKTYDIYGHITDSQVPIKSKVSPGDLIGYLAEKSEPGFMNIPHLHLMVTKEKRIKINKDLTYFDYFICPSENPLSLLIKSGLIKDEVNPILIHQYDNPGSIDIISEKDGSVDKTILPWKVKGKVDITARAADFMGQIGSFNEKEYLPGIAEIKYEIFDSKHDKIDEVWLLNQLNENSNFHYALPGDYKSSDNFDTIRKSLMESYLAIFALGEREYQVKNNVYVLTNIIKGVPSKEGYWDTTILKNGSYTIKVTAYDLAKNNCSDSLEVLIDNEN